MRSEVVGPDPIKVNQQETELGRLEGELRRLADVIATAGGDVPSLMTAIRAREQERVRVQGRSAELAATSQVAHMDRARLLRDLRQRLTDWQGVILMQPGAAGVEEAPGGALGLHAHRDGSGVQRPGAARSNPGRRHRGVERAT